MGNTIENEELIAAAMTAILQETGLSASMIRILSFHEVEESSLQKYIKRNNIAYKKYQLGDETV